MKFFLLLWIQAVASQSPSPTGSPKPSPTPTLSRQPSSAPTTIPTGSPKPSPTPTLSRQPSSAPTNSPTKVPSNSPSASFKPSQNPSVSTGPSVLPSFTPSDTPSLSALPSYSPSKNPTFSVSPAPSVTPTASPKPSPSPSSTPSKLVVPTSSNTPSSIPTSSLVPSASPTTAPSSFSPPPTQSPKPSPSPSAAPTADFPSTTPSASPKPSPSPSSAPSHSPSMLPSVSIVPTKVASLTPSVEPSVSSQPSAEPSSSPSADPSSIPSVSPTSGPSSLPSVLPSGSMSPSDTPSSLPSEGPTALPSVTPSLSQSPSYGSGTLVGMEVDFELPRCPPSIENLQGPDLLNPSNYFNVDVDGDGTKDAWGGKLFQDQDDNQIQVVCLPAVSSRTDFEYHVLVNGDSVAKSPWLGGRNKLWIYGLDFDLDGMIEFVDDNTAVALRGVLWESQDGPLPGEAFLDGEGSEVEYSPNPNITEFTRDIYNTQCDDDLDGFIDISIYRYMIGDRNAVKTHFERGDYSARQATSPDLFVPGVPENTPDDYLDQAGQVVESANFPEDIDLITMKTNPFEEVPPFLLLSEEEVIYAGQTYDVKFETTNALLFGFEILNGVITVFFQPISPGQGVVQLPFDLLEVLGFGVGYPVNYTATGDITLESRSVNGEYEVFTAGFKESALVTLTIAYEEIDLEDVAECVPDGTCSTSNAPEVCTVNGTVTFAKCCCFLGCSWKVGLIDACPGICFSSHMTVQEESKGVVPIDQINIGDKILANAGGSYETVYSWSHFQPNKQAEFLQLTAKASDRTVTIELSDDHMIFVSGRAIPASQVQLGDSLHLESGMMAKVTMIETVSRIGQFAPLTASGTILVNDVLSSVYVSLQGSDSLELVPGVSSPISMQWVAHTFTTLRRWKCVNLPGACTNELHRDGLADWIEAPLSFCLWFLNKQSVVLQLFILVPGVCTGFLLWVLDTLPRWLLLTAGVCYYCWKRTRSIKEKED